MVNDVDRLDNLIKEISKDKELIRFKELEIIIDDKLKNDFANLLILQKKMINLRESNSTKYESIKILYNKEKQKVMEHILVSEYLELIEYLNNELSLIQEILTKEIAIDFE